jgi:YidC/Oxa1 family membrane protein insertase
MDRQTRIALGLMLLLFIVYMSYVSRFRPEPSSTGAPADSLATEELVETDGATPPAEFGAPADSPPPLRSEDTGSAGFGDQVQPQREIVVQTQSVRYTLASRGALLKSVELLNYEGIDSEFVQLIGPKEDGRLDGVLAVNFGDPGRPIASVDWDFAVDLPAGVDSLYLRAGEEASLIFSVADGAGGELTKTFLFKGEGYELGLELEARLQGGLAGVDGVMIDWSEGLLSTEKNRKDDVSSFNNYYLVGDKQEKRSLKNFKEADGRASLGERSPEGTLQWAATRSKYFLAALLPDQLQSATATLVGDNEDQYLGFIAEFPLRAGRDYFGESFRVYTGPLLYEELKSYDRGLESLVDMGKLVRPISLAMKWIMDFLSRFIPNYGVIIILLSVLTKVAFYRLTHKSFKSMKDMQAVQPKMKELQEKYKGDREKLNKATMELYKEHGVNPLGGCLPLLLQMPVFFALYRLLRGAVELRGAGFVGWIDDLSTADVLFTLPFSIPFLGDAFSVLPILMGASMWVQQKLGGSGMGMGDGTSPAAGQMAAMNKIMPIFMTFIFYRMPSGLVLYWLVNNILTAVQQYYIHKGMDADAKVVTAKA